MDADKHGYLDGGFIRVHLLFIRGSFFSTGFAEVVEGNTHKARGQTFVFTVPLIALFNHGWTRINTDIWTGFYPCSSAFIRGSFFSTGFTEVVEGNTNKVRGQTFVFTVPLIALF